MFYCSAEAESSMEKSERGGYDAEMELPSSAEPDTNLYKLRHHSFSFPVSTTNISGERSNSFSSSATARTLSNNSRQKKFCTYFHPLNEPVLEYYACALARDIPLQGHLYITGNHFAFYSHILGFTKRILIKLGDVNSITKGKSAKILPNAITVCTTSYKYVFTSLLSRDSAFKVMTTVWEEYLDLLKQDYHKNNSSQDLEDGADQKMLEDYSASERECASANVSSHEFADTVPVIKPETTEKEKPQWDKKVSKVSGKKYASWLWSIKLIPSKQVIIMLLLVIFTSLLAGSAYVLFNKISDLQQKLSENRAESEMPKMSN